jgi:hypothetical protein
MAVGLTIVANSNHAADTWTDNFQLGRHRRGSELK